MHGDYPWWVFFPFFGSFVVAAVAALWLADRGIGGKALVLVGVAGLYRLWGWALPRFRRDEPPEAE